MSDAGTRSGMKTEESQVTCIVSIIGVLILVNISIYDDRIVVCIQVDWTPDLHKKFVQAVEQLGVDQAIPSRILELMKVEGLTRHNVASHLQVGIRSSCRKQLCKIKTIICH